MTNQLNDPDYARIYFSRIPPGTDEETARLAGVVMQLGTAAHVFIPPVCALQIVRALRGEDASRAELAPAAPGE